MALVQAVENGKITESTTETTTSAGNDLGYDEFLAAVMCRDAVSGSAGTDEQYRVCGTAGNFFTDGVHAEHAEQH